MALRRGDAPILSEQEEPPSIGGKNKRVAAEYLRTFLPNT